MLQVKPNTMTLIDIMAYALHHRWYFLEPLA